MARGDRDRTRERDQVRERLLQQNRTPEQIAAAMAQQLGDRPRPAWRQAYGWTQQEVADRYNREVSDPNASMTAHRISDFERWPINGAGTKPTIPTLGVLARVYSTKVSKLIDHHDRRKMSNAELITCAIVDSGIIPRQLPATISNFVGRAHELDILTAQLDRSGGDRGPVVITAIGGTAGIGKTTLALYWAQHNNDRFPDGQLYIDLHGFSPSGSPVTSQEAIRGFLDAFQIPEDKIPDNLDDQAAFYRTLVEGRRLLIVLDNARDADQVQPLLPGSPTCLVLVTSRQQLGSLIARNQAVHITLDFMTPVEARQLLTAVVGAERMQAEPEAIEELVRYCVGLPLALNIAAARIMAEPHLPLSTLVGQLREQRQRLDTLSTGDSQLTDIRAVFSWSYTALLTGAARLFRLLGLHPGPDASLYASASLAGLPEQDTRQLLTELTRAHLLKQHISGRYQLHDLLRVYAIEQVTDGEPEPQRRAALNRVLDYYLHTGFAAYLNTGFTVAGHLNPSWDPTTLPSPRSGVALPQITDYEQGQEWLTAEHTALLAGIDYAATHGFDNHAWQLSWIIADFLYRQGRWREWAAIQRNALIAADRLGEPEAQARTHHSLGNAYTYLKESEQAINHYRQALDFYQAVGNDEGQARVYDGLGWAYAAHGQHDEAVSSTQRALDFYQDLGDQNGQARLLNDMGWVYILGGQHSQGSNYARRALDLFCTTGNPHGQDVALDTLSLANWGLNEYDQVIIYCQQATNLYRAAGNRFFQAQTLTRLGDAHQAIDDPTTARQAWRKALTIFDQLGHPDAYNVRTKLADVGIDTNRTDL